MELSRTGLEWNYLEWNERSYLGRNNLDGIVLDGTLGWNCPEWKCQGTLLSTFHSYLPRPLYRTNFFFNLVYIKQFKLKICLHKQFLLLHHCFEMDQITNSFEEFTITNEKLN